MRSPFALWMAAALTSLALAACVEPVASGGARPGGDALAAEVARLKSLGFRPAGRAGAEGAVRLAYAGPINGAVLCAPRGGTPGRLQAETRLADGSTRTVTLDAYVTLMPGADGVWSPKERDGLYAVSVVTRPGAGGAPKVQGITFGPGGQASFASGLTCRAV